MKLVLGAYLISGGGLADLRGGLAPAGPPPVATGLYTSLYVSTFPVHSFQRVHLSSFTRKLKYSISNLIQYVYVYMLSSTR